MRPQAFAHFRKREWLDRALKIPHSGDAGLGAEEVHGVVKVQRGHGERGEVQHPQVRHKDGVASTSGCVMSGIGAFQPGESAFLSSAEFLDVRAQFGKLGQVHFEIRG